jgi:hypothetical protein
MKPADCLDEVEAAVETEGVEEDTGPCVDESESRVEHLSTLVTLPSFLTHS